jgi:hypothetical protein
MFSLDAMRLQKKFEKTRRYEAKTYEQAAREVYQNQEYMRDLYLPGILLSHYLWPHHYRQLQFFRRSYVPLATAMGRVCSTTSGLERASIHGRCSRLFPDFGASDTISAHIPSPLRRPSSWPGATARDTRFAGRISWRCQLTHRTCVISVEVLEHLEDPLTFLKALAGMLSAGGVGFITAALTAPNADHIYLYSDVSEVISQLDEAGLRTDLFQEEIAYEPKADEPVPRVAAFIVRHKSA